MFGGRAAPRAPGAAHDLVQLHHGERVETAVLAQRLSHRGFCLRV